VRREQKLAPFSFEARLNFRRCSRGHVEARWNAFICSARGVSAGDQGSLLAASHLVSDLLRSKIAKPLRAGEFSLSAVKMGGTFRAQWSRSNAELQLRKGCFIRLFRSDFLSVSSASSAVRTKKSKFSALYLARFPAVPV
jgi:hypothetical protein